MNKIIVLIITSLILVYGCSQTTQNENSIEKVQNENPEEKTTQVQTPAWQTIELEDINSGQTYTIENLKGKPILLESFAVWCPTCTRQQEILKELHKEVGDDIISISLDTDPNEDVQTVKDHIGKHGFDWIYSISPIELTKQLIDEFGVGVVNAPSVPIILICENGESYLLDRGIKQKQDILDQIQTRC